MINRDCHAWGVGGVLFLFYSLKLEISKWNRGRCEYERRWAVSKQRPEFFLFFIMLQWTGGRLNARKSPSWTLSSNYPLHPRLSSLFFCSLQSFFSSSLSPPIVVIKLVGFCGFELEQGETQVYLCFLTGSLHRERELKWVDCKRGAGDTGERSHWLKVTFVRRCDKTANLLHMQPGELAMSSHCFHLHVHETTGARKWHGGGIQCVRFKSFGCAALRRARILNLCVCVYGWGWGRGLFTALY